MKHFYQLVSGVVNTVILVIYLYIPSQFTEYVVPRRQGIYLQIEGARFGINSRYIFLDLFFNSYTLILV